MSSIRIIHVPIIFFSTTYSITLQLWKKNCEIIYVPTPYISFHDALPKPKNFFFPFFLIHSSSTLLYPSPKSFFFFSLFSHPLVHFFLIFLFSFYFNFLHTKAHPPPPTHTHTHVSLSLPPSLFSIFSIYQKLYRIQKVFLRLDM